MPKLASDEDDDLETGSGGRSGQRPLALRVLAAASRSISRRRLSRALFFFRLLLSPLLASERFLLEMAYASAGMVGVRVRENEC